MKFNELNLSPEMSRAIADCGYTEATYIQSACIPVVMNGGDVIGQSQTGTGKTAAFAIPIIEMLEVTDRKRPQALILSPTRELAMQVCDEIRKFTKYKEGIRTVAVYGGQQISKQILELKKGADIVVGTPGRVLDHIRRRTLRFDQCRVLVLDEADEMLNMGFREDIETVIEALPQQRQTVLFSATMPKPILEITSQYQTNPVHIKTPQTQINTPKIEQVYYVCPKEAKKEILMQLISMQNPHLAMIFCNTKKMVDELTSDLVSKGYPAAALHGDMKQEMRTGVMDNFKKGKINILVATDVAARGIDVDSMDVVFNYDLPQESEYYVHRIGRTGRAGKEGLAVTLITARQKYALRDLERTTRSKLTQKPLPSLEEVRKIRLDFLREDLEHRMTRDVPEPLAAIIDTMKDDGYSYREMALALAYQIAGHEMFDESAWNASARPALTVTEKGMSELILDIGSDQDVCAAIIVSAIATATGLPGKDIGKIRISAQETTVQIPRQFDREIADAMKNTPIKGQTVHPLLMVRKGKDYSNLPPKRRAASKGPRQRGRRRDSRD